MLGMVVDVQILSFISTSGIQKMLGMVVDVQILSFISTNGIQKMFGMVVDGGITKCRMSGPMDTQ
jgi:hypothetical protein